MILDKLPWCSHTVKGSDNPIFSVHVHPDGGRFATGGIDNKVKVWNMAAAVDARQEENANVPKLLATLADHAAPVNVVRFSNSGRLLASGSDDCMSCIFELQPGPSMASFGAESNTENWRAKRVLNGHKSHVVDVAWSPDDTRLATASLDCKVYIWDMAHGHILATLTGHSSFVKGLAWDPVGSYLATQSDDKSVAIWRTDDWSLVHSIQAPFKQMVFSTFANRLAWSPDGQHLLAGNSYQGTTHSAVAIPRGSWNKPGEYLLVNGHSGAVVCCAFSPRLMHLPGPSPGAPPSEELSAVFTLGGQDKRLTVWAASAQRPLFCGTKLFKSQVMDVAWAPNGRVLLACSSDGSVACLHFDRSELGDPASEEEMQEVMKALYGSSGGRPSKRAFAESAEQLQLEERAAAASLASPVRNGPAAAPAASQPHRPALAALQQPAAVPAVSSDAMAALAARLEAPMVGGATSQLGFGTGAPAAPIVTTVVPRPAATAPQSNGKRAADAAIMPPPPPRPAAAPAPQAAKRARVEPVAAPPAAAAAPMLLLAVPKTLPELRVHLGRASVLLGGEEPVELRIVNKERGLGGLPQADLTCTRSSTPFWSDVVRGSVVAAAGTLHFAAAATADGHLLLYSPAGRRLAAPLKLGAGVALLAAGCETRLLVMTTAGTVKVLDVSRLVQVMEAPAGPLLQGGGSVLDAKLSKAGAPMVTLSDSKAYAWHGGFQAWMCVADDSVASSQFAPLMRLPEHGELSALQAEAMAAGGRAMLAPSTSSSASATQRQLSRGHAEGNLAAALALGSADEYRRWLVTYARCLAETGDAARLVELCDSLMGPAPGVEAEEADGDEGAGSSAAAGSPAQGSGAGGDAAPPRWSPAVLGLSKRRLLRDEVLREVARNRALGGLLQRCSLALEEIEAAEGGGTL